MILLVEDTLNMRKLITTILKSENIEVDEAADGEEALKKLPKEYLEAYEMNRNQHLTHKEIAEKLNVSPQTINYRIGQALKLLRVALKDYLPLFILIFGPNFFEQS